MLPPPPAREPPWPQEGGLGAAQHSATSGHESHTDTAVHPTTRPAGSTANAPPAAKPQPGAAQSSDSNNVPPTQRQAQHGAHTPDAGPSDTHVPGHTGAHTPECHNQDPGPDDGYHIGNSMTNHPMHPVAMHLLQSLATAHSTWHVSPNSSYRRTWAACTDSEAWEQYVAHVVTEAFASHEGLRVYLSHLFLAPNIASLYQEIASYVARSSAHILRATVVYTVHPDHTADSSAARPCCRTCADTIMCALALTALAAGIWPMHLVHPGPPPGPSATPLRPLA